MAKLEWEMTDRVLREGRLFEPSAQLVENANITQYMQKKGKATYDDLHAWTISEPEAFWSEMGQELDWFEPWSKVLDWNAPYAKWFVDAKCNIVYNALDRHMSTPVRNKVAYYWEGEDGSTRTISYAELYREVNRAASALSKLGIKKGDRVIVYLPRVPEQIVAILAIARLGAVHSVVFSAFSAHALRDRIEDAGAKMVITADGYPYAGKVLERKSEVDAALQDNKTVEHVVVVRRANLDVPMTSGRDVEWSDIMQTADAYHPCVPVDSEDLLYTLYTSGTTGKPKGIAHVHGGYMVGIYATSKFTFDLKADDIYWCTADIGWVTGHSYILYGPLICGATSVYYEGAPTIPNPGRFWSIVERYGVTILYTAPTAIRGLMRFGDEWPQKYDLSSIRLMGSVGEPINPEAWVWYHTLIGKERCPIMDTWWQTETGAHMITPLPIIPLKPGSATKPFLGINADVVDKTGQPVGHNHGGYLVVKQPWPSMLRTVYNDPARYEQYWNTIPGKYFAGDAAHKDDHGYFWIQGRVDDVLNVSGHRLGSMEVESALVSHPAVAEAAVIGKPHPVKGEGIKAFCILRAGHEASEGLIGELKTTLRQEVGPIAVPDEIEFVSSLPKTRSGKIMRRLLKARELGHPVGDLSTLDE